MGLVENLKKLINEQWFKQAMIGGAFAFIATWSFGLFGLEIKNFLFSLFENAFFRWGLAVSVFAVLSDIFFAFVVRK